MGWLPDDYFMNRINENLSIVLDLGTIIYKSNDSPRIIINRQQSLDSKNRKITYTK